MNDIQLPRRDNHEFCPFQVMKFLNCFLKYSLSCHFQMLTNPAIKTLLCHLYLLENVVSKSLTSENILWFLAEGIPSIGMSPFSCGWSTCERNVRRYPEDCIFWIYTSIMRYLFPTLIWVSFFWLNLNHKNLNILSFVFTDCLSWRVYGG